VIIKGRGYKKKKKQRKTKYSITVILSVALWVMILCNLIGKYPCFGAIYCLHLQGRRWRQHLPPKYWYPSNRLHSVII
jgi:hypothetical protein